MNLRMKKGRPPSGERGTDRVKRELLLFWGTHSNARFDWPTICYALEGNGVELERALSGLVASGLVDVCVQNGQTFYSLTTNEERRRPIVELATPGHNWW